MQRFTSRKFLLATATFVAAVLVSAGVIEGSEEVALVGFLAPALYILVEGVIDLIAKR